MVFNVKAGENGYDVVVGRGILSNVGKLLNLDRRVLVVTDDGVPTTYSEKVEKACEKCVKVCLKQGEQSKNFDNFKLLLHTMLQNDFTRKDCVVAVGGGVVGDIAAFSASCYMRGIEFYNVPTTLLSQLDSSIGGKTAIDFEGVKNVVGSFYQPSKVIMDVETLDTLDERQLHAGLVEAIKMAATSDKNLFERIEKSENLKDDLLEIVQASLAIKKDVVEKDPKEKGLRKVLNFGHTLGHAIESEQKGALLHGECVGIGMLPMCSEEVEKRLEKVLKKYDLPTAANCDKNELLRLMTHDKKADGSKIRTVVVNEIGSFEFADMTAKEILDREDRL